MKIILSLLCIIGMSTAHNAIAEDAQKNTKYEIHIKNHKFTPDILEIPANQKVRVIVHNDDPTPEEFESHDLNREKIIRGNSKAVIFVGPVKAGEYKFFGEFNEATAQGKIIAK